MIPDRPIKLFDAFLTGVGIHVVATALALFVLWMVLVDFVWDRSQSK